MGYFDALTSGYFKTTPEGRKLFFPSGVLGRGYAIKSQQDYERLRRQVKAYTIVSLVLIVGVTALQAYVGAVVIGALSSPSTWAGCGICCVACTHRTNDCRCRTA